MGLLVLGVMVCTGLAAEVQIARSKEVKRLDVAWPWCRSRGCLAFH